MAMMLAAVALATVGCPVERASYALRHHPEVTARFRVVESGADWPSGVALGVHDRRAGKTVWWLPWNGGSDGLQNVASTGDVTDRGWRPPSPDGGPRPYGDRAYMGFTARYDIIDHAPVRGEPAPAHMLFPGSGGSQDRAFPVRAFFDLVGCAPQRR